MQNVLPFFVMSVSPKNSTELSQAFLELISVNNDIKNLCPIVDLMVCYFQKLRVLMNRMVAYVVPLMAKCSTIEF